jgi:hypothetical protein
MPKKIIYSGFTRTWEQVKENQKENIIEYGDELLFYTTEEPICQQRYEWTRLGPQLLHGPVFERQYSRYSSNAAGETSIINTLNQWRNRRDAFGLYGLDDKKTIVIARTDINLSAKVNFTIEPNVVYIPEGQDYGGLNDQFAFGDYAAMKYYCSMYDRIDEYWNAGCKFHPETLLAYHLRNTMVIRIPVQTQIIRL